jgi:hypothetical protein
MLLLLLMMMTVLTDRVGQEGMMLQLLRLPGMDGGLGSAEEEDQSFSSTTNTSAAVFASSVLVRTRHRGEEAVSHVCVWFLFNSSSHMYVCLYVHVYIRYVRMYVRNPTYILFYYRW